MNICESTGLPAVADGREMNEFFLKNCGEHPTPLLATWKCKDCGMMHFKTAGSFTDSNGTFKAGANKLSDAVVDLIRKTAVLESVWISPVVDHGRMIKLEMLGTKNVSVKWKENRP